MSQNVSWQHDKDWSDKILQASAEILSREMALVVVRLRRASNEEDTKRATDFVVETTTGDVAVRVRRAGRPPGYFKRYKGEVTIRSGRDRGTKTELAKIREGFGQYYFYAWTDDERIVEWVIFDLAAFRALGLWEGREEIPNGDGTWFIAIPASALLPTVVRASDGWWCVAGCTKEVVA